MFAIAAMAVLTAIVVPSYAAYIRKAKVSAAIGDIMTIKAAIDRYDTNYNAPPPDLATIGMDTKLDPWKHPYAYLSFQGLKGKGQMRKDKSLVPINTRFDLYSMGEDGQSRAPLTAAASRDDIVMANDGSFIGLASDY